MRAEAQDRQRAETEIVQPAVERADSIVFRVLRSRAGRWGVMGAAGLTTTASMLLTGCGATIDHPSQETPVAGAAKTPDIRGKLTQQNLKDAASDIEVTRTIINEFIGGSLIVKTHKYDAIVERPPHNLFPDITKLLSPSSGQDYIQLVEGWARQYQGRTADKGDFRTLLPIIAEDISGGGYGLVNEYYDGQYIGTAISTIAIRPYGSNIRVPYPEIVKFFGGDEDTYKLDDGSGRTIKLLFKVASLPDLARTYFTLPEEITWKPILQKQGRTQYFEGGNIPAVEGRFDSSQGPARITVNAFGGMTLRIGQTPGYDGLIH